MNNLPKKIRAMIVDDEPIARRGIRQHLQDVPDVEVIGECKNGREAVAAIEKQKPDLVFLDVQMPLLDGFGVVQAVGANDMPTTVFVTAFDEHAIRAFEINALDYLLKPVDPERFQKMLERVRKQLQNSKTTELNQKLSVLLENIEVAKSKPELPVYLQRFVVKDAGRITFVDVDEIDWISSEGNYIKLHTSGKTHLLRETMDAMEHKLTPQKFIRLRRSTIVRIEKIKELHPLFNGEYALILRDGTKLTSSRRYRKNLDIILDF